MRADSAQVARARLDLDRASVRAPITGLAGAVLVRAGNLVGTPEQVAERIRAYVDLGCTGFYPWCSDYPDTETLRLFAAVAAELR